MSRSWRERLGALPEHPRLLGIAMLLSSLALLPMLFTGFALDDWFQLAHLQEQLYPHQSWAQRLDLFHLVSPEVLAFYEPRGIVPWWAHPEAKAVFFRPLAALSHWLDWWLFPKSALWAHLHSLGWHLGCIWAFHRLGRRVLSQPGALGLATLIFAVADSHALPVHFNANRNAVMAVFFILLASESLLRVLEEDRGWVGLSSWTLLAFSCGELGLSLLALPLALWLRAPAERARLRLLLWTGLLGISWLVLLRLMGSGSAHLGLYQDPLADPLRSLRLVAERLPVLVLHLTLKVPLDGLNALREEELLAPGLLTGLGLGVWGWRQREALRPVTQHWLLLTFLISFLPVCFTVPSSRNVMLPSVWLSLMLGRLIWGGWGRLLGWLHLPLAWLATLGITLGFGWLGRVMEDNWLRIPDMEPEQQLILVNGMDVAAASCVIQSPQIRDGAPASITLLSPLVSELELLRSGARELELSFPGGMMELPNLSAFRDPDWEWAPGQRWRHLDLEVEVLELSEWGDPARLRLSLARPLDDPRYVWVHTQGLDVLPFQLPAIGESVRLIRGMR